jgi:ABC-2 type transport system permease protein
MNLFQQKLRVVLKRDLLVALRLRGGIAAIISLLFEVGGLFYLARSVGAGYRPEGVDYFAFATVGTAFVTFLLAGMGSFVHVIQEFQSLGMLEIMFTSRTSPTGVVCFNAAPTLVRYGLTLIVTFLAAYALLSGSPPHFNLLSAVTVFLLSVILIAILGLIAAAVQVVLRKGTALLWLAGSAAWLLSGAMYPVDALPPLLQKFALFVPITYAINAFRGAVLKGASLFEIRYEVAALTVLIALLGPISIALLNAALRIARRRGLLSLF